MGDEEKTDLDSSANEFLAIFAKAEETEKTKLLSVFLKSARINYKDVRGSLKSNISPTAILDVFLFCDNTLLGTLSSNISNSAISERLGIVFGKLIAVFRYGIASNKILLNPAQHGRIVLYCGDINTNLKKLGKSVRVTYLKKAIERIAKEKGAVLDANNKLLISRCAAALAA